MLTVRLLQSSTNRGTVFAMIAALDPAVVEPRPVIAGTVAAPSKGGSATTASSDFTDFNAARRRQYRRGGSSAGLIGARRAQAITRRQGN
jgi:hypothetical protein